MNIQLVIPHRNGNLSRTEVEIVVHDKKIKATILSEVQGYTDTIVFLSIPDSELISLQRVLPCEQSKKASII